MQKISVICPIYNGEKFVRECFDSVISQSFTNWEMIVVDDGSVDCSADICDEYSKNDSRIKVYHIENHGVSYARNFAITKAIGDFCFFLDCDDILPQDALEYLIKLAEEKSADMVAGEAIHFSDKLKIHVQEDVLVYEYNGEQEIYENVIFDINELKPFPKKDEKRKINNGMWGCLYKTAIIKEHNVAFLHTKTGEDLFFSVNFYMFCKKVIMTSKKTYGFRINPFSVTHRYIKKYFDDVLECYVQFDKLYNNFPEQFVDRAKDGLNAWHYYRCRLAIEREFTYGGGTLPAA